MTLQNNIGERLEEAKREAAARLLRAELYFVQQHQQRLGVPNTGEQRIRKRNTVAGKKGSSYTVYPNPSKPGEYPRKVTGQGQSGVIGSAATPDDVLADGMKARIGLVPLAKHIAILEFARNRLGFVRSVKDLAAPVKAILEK